MRETTFELFDDAGITVDNFVCEVNNKHYGRQAEVNHHGKISSLMTFSSGNFLTEINAPFNRISVGVSQTIVNVIPGRYSETLNEAKMPSVHNQYQTVSAYIPDYEPTRLPHG